METADALSAAHALSVMGAETLDEVWEKLAGHHDTHADASGARHAQDPGALRGGLGQPDRPDRPAGLAEALPSQPDGVPDVGVVIVAAGRFLILLLAGALELGFARLMKAFRESVPPSTLRWTSLSHAVPRSYFRTAGGWR